MRRFVLPVLAALVSAAAVASISLAGSGTSGSSTSSANDRRSGPPPTLAEVFKEARERRNARLNRVAERLDVSGDRLRDAIDKVMRDQLDADVRANRLTDAQRDAILACKSAPLTCDRSNLPAFRFRHRGFGPGRPRPARRDEFFEALARELRRDEDDVREAFAAERPRHRDGRHSGERFHHGPGPGGAMMVG